MRLLLDLLLIAACLFGSILVFSCIVAGRRADQRLREMQQQPTFPAIQRAALGIVSSDIRSKELGGGPPF